jgi:hypothetical protein
MENPQKIEFKSLDDLLCYLPQEELKSSFSSQHCPGMYADCKEKISSFYRHSKFVIYGQPQFLEIIPKGGIGFAKVIHF